MQIVKHYDHAKKVSYKILMKDEIKALEKEIALEKKHSSRATSEAKKLWRKENIKGTFPMCFPRRIQVNRKTYKDLSKVSEEVMRLEEKLQEEKKADKHSEAVKLGKALTGTTAGTKAWYRTYAKHQKGVNKRFIKQLEKEIGWHMFAEQMALLMPAKDDDDESTKEKELFKVVSENGEDYPNVQTHYKLLKPIPCPIPGKTQGNLAESAKLTVSTFQDYTLKEGVVDGIVAGDVSGYPLCEWSARIPDNKAFVLLSWSKAQKIGRILIFDRPHESINVASGKIVFDDGSFITTSELPKDGETGLDIQFEPKSTKTVRFEIIKRSDAVDHTGLSEIAVYK